MLKEGNKVLTDLSSGLTISPDHAEQNGQQAESHSFQDM
jgi:hypothetical protein